MTGRHTLYEGPGYLGVDSGDGAVPAMLCELTDATHERLHEHQWKKLLADEVLRPILAIDLGKPGRCGRVVLQGEAISGRSCQNIRGRPGSQSRPGLGVDQASQKQM